VSKGIDKDKNMVYNILASTRRRRVPIKLKGGYIMYRMTPYKRRNNLAQRDVFDLFDDFFNAPTSYVRDFRIDVQDLKDKYIVEAEVPGLDKKDLNIKFENDYLTISINKEEETEDKDDDKKYLHRERYAFKSERRVYLEDVDPKKLNASLKDGILSIELMKLEHKISSYMIDIK
jgi:HSP20 family protein